MSDDHGGGHGGGHGDAHGGGHGGPADDGQRQAIVFVGIIAAAAAFLLLLFGAGVPPALIILLAAALAIVGAFFPRVRTIKETERGVVYIFGKFSHVIGPGLHWYIPYYHTMTHVDMRTQTVDVKPQPVVTTDNIRLMIDSILYWRVTDARKFATQARDPAAAMTQLVLSQTRNVVSRMSLQEVLERTNEINENLQHVLEDVSEQWGVQVQKVEVQRIELPKELVEAFQKKREAEENRSRVEIEAKGRQIQLEILEQAASQMSDKTLAYLYLDALKKISEGKSNKLIFPLELSHLASSLSGQLSGGFAKKNEPGGMNYEAILGGLLSAYKEREASILTQQPASASSSASSASAATPEELAARKTKLLPVVTAHKESPDFDAAELRAAPPSKEKQTTLSETTQTRTVTRESGPGTPPWVTRDNNARNGASNASGNSPNSLEPAVKFPARRPGVRFQEIDESEHPTADMSGQDEQ